MRPTPPTTPASIAAVYATRPPVQCSPRRWVRATVWSPASLRPRLRVPASSHGVAPRLAGVIPPSILSGSRLDPLALRGVDPHAGAHRRRQRQRCDVPRVRARRLRSRLTSGIADRGLQRLTHWGTARYSLRPPGTIRASSCFPGPQPRVVGPPFSASWRNGRRRTPSR
jgi:hypothetical protein